jgi:aldose 1-epimerase
MVSNPAILRHGRVKSNHRREIHAMIEQGKRTSGISIQPFGTIADRRIDLYTLRNRRGMAVRAINYGATIVAIEVANRHGIFDDVVLGFDSLQDYQVHGWYCGATIGRYAGRIRMARFAFEGQHYSLSANEGATHLHGGFHGFDKAVWQGDAFESEGDRVVRLRHVSPAGEDGYPGTLSAQVVYTLTDMNELVVDLLATTDQPTPVNMTHHSYFNLCGSARQDILDHQLQISADHFLPIDAALLPTGERRGVRDTPFDFRQARRIGDVIDVPDEQLRRGQGFDHDFVLRDASAACLVEPISGRALDVFTTQPSLHIYTGNYLNGIPLGKGQVPYRRRFGIALEAQHFPDSPNQPSFPSTIVQPGQQYHARTVYRFSVTED